MTDKKRITAIQVRVTEQEKRKLERQAKRCGLSKTVWPVWWTMPKTRIRLFTRIYKMFSMSKPDKVDGKQRQRADIHYNIIGLWCAPSPEEMEKLFQKHLAGQRKKTE